MKRYLLLIIWCLGLLGCMTSCFEDEGNYTYRTLGNFYVDTTGVKTALTVVQFSDLSLSSGLVYSGDKSGLDFSWAIYLASSGQTTVVADTLTRTENLSTKIEVSPGSYKIEFCATERITGIRATMIYDLTVESAVGTGLLVFYQKDGTLDCDLIKTPFFNGSLSASSVSRKLYSQANPGRPLTGEPVRCGFLSYNNFTWVSILTETNAIRLSSEDMSLMYSFDAMFLTAPEVCKPEGYSYFNGLEVLINDGKVYTTLIGWAGDLPLFASAKILMEGNCKSASYAFPGRGNTLIVYDEGKGRFLYGNCYSSELLEIPYVADKSVYDMTAIRKDLLYMDEGFCNVTGNYGYAIMESVDDMKQYCYVYSTGYNLTDCNGVAILDLTDCEKVKDAKYYAFGTRGPIIYYATEKEVYRVNFDLDTQTVTSSSDAAWTCPEGETITCMRIFRGAGINLEENPEGKYLMIATFNGTEGKVYILGADIASGVLTSEPLADFGQFGKIKDLQFKSK